MEKKNTKRSSNREIALITYIFVGIFIFLLANFSYFIFIQSKDVINNPYNGRQDLLAQRIVRGKILSNNHEILAETVIDESGNETRYYPYDHLFAHIVGRFSKGKTGIELSENFNMLTCSINGIEKLTNEMAGNKNLGDNVVTTLDVNLQKTAYDALGNKKGAIVVLEPSTGKILAMVSKPDYNPNTVIMEWESLVEDKEKESFLLNRATQGLYPPGSTFKILTALAYMREKGNSQKYSYTCTGKDIFSSVLINCYGNKVHKELDLKSSFAKSCNTSFANMGMNINMDSFRALCEKFLFNQALPTDLSYSQSSFILDGTSDRQDIPQTAIGQGKTQITPFHNALITAAIANGGVLMNPYVVDYLEDAYKNIVSKTTPKSYGTLLSTEETKWITEYMVAVIKEGTGTKLKGLSYTVAGKTGSAEYDSSKSSHAWFVGFAPVNEPQVVVSILVEDGGTGSESAIPIAKKIFDQVLKK